MKAFALLIVAWMLTVSCFCGANRIKAPVFDFSAVDAYREIAASIHPAWEKVYPVCVLSGDTLSLYRYHQGDGWVPEKQKPAPDWMWGEIRAAFPLDIAGWETTCVVDAKALGNDEVAFVYHEFVHCYQAATCENTIKATMELARENPGNGKWELDYPFPYHNEFVAEKYLEMMNAAERGDSLTVRRTRAEIYTRVTPRDWEYLVWQEFKEGSARHLENRLRARIGQPLSKSRREKPLNRVTFYEGGDLMITLLLQTEPSLVYDFPKIWKRLVSYR